MMFNWKQKWWPKATCNRAALRDELKAFEAAFRTLKKSLKAPQDMEVVARALTDEAVKTSAIEGVNVDESVVMSSICKALGVKYAPKGFTKDARGGREGGTLGGEVDAHGEGVEADGNARSRRTHVARRNRIRRPWRTRDTVSPEHLVV